MHRIWHFIRKGDARAFSINEVIIVMAITVFLSGILLSYNRSSEKQIVIFKDQALIVGVVNRAKSLAAERYTGSGGANACAFGVEVDIAAKRIVLFQDIKPGNDVFSCKEIGGSYAPSVSNGFIYSPDIDSREMLETVSLDPRTIMTMTANGANVADKGDILFIPPDIDATSTNAFPLVITLRDESGVNSGYVRILANGQVTTR
jgi:hypothetical protein